MNPIVSVYANILGSEEKALQFLQDSVSNLLVYSRPGDEEVDSVPVVECSVDLSIVQISLDSIVPEEFAKKFMPTTTVLNRHIYEVSLARTQWRGILGEADIMSLNIDAEEDAFYNEFMSENKGGKATDAKKYASEKVSALRMRNQSTINNVKLLIEDCDSLIRYIASIRDCFLAYANVFTVMKDSLAISADDFKMTLAQVLADTPTPRRVIPVETPEEDALLASMKKKKND